jgi:hypothetical protein
LRSLPGKMSIFAVCDGKEKDKSSGFRLKNMPGAELVALRLFHERGEHEIWVEWIVDEKLGGSDIDLTASTLALLLLDMHSI